jgi:hypothetical protein
MLRLLLCLPLCLLLQDERVLRELGPVAADTVSATRVASGQILKLDDAAMVRQQLLAALPVTPTHGFPGTLSWATALPLTAKGLFPLEMILHYQPTEFLKMCLERSEREVKGYSCTFRKRERIAGKLNPVEVIDVHFKERPHSVFFEWRELGNSRAKRVIYVEGENDGKMQARPSGFGVGFLILSVALDSNDAKQSGRYTIAQFGMKLGTERSLASMLKAREHGGLHVVYQGAFNVPEVGNRICYKFLRKPYEPLEEEGVNELTIYIDTETWLQVGSELRDLKGELIAEYYFRDIKLNPEFKSNQFQRGAL